MHLHIQRGRRGDLEQVDEIRLRAAVVDDENVDLGRRLAQRDEAAQDDLEIVRGAQVDGHHCEAGERFGHPPVIGYGAAVLSCPLEVSSASAGRLRRPVLPGRQRIEHRPLLVLGEFPRRPARARTDE
ncbi:hypothetical protein BH20ACT16_BH20ACT16_10480 [soil metagenome]